MAPLGVSRRGLRFRAIVRRGDADRPIIHDIAWEHEARSSAVRLQRSRRRASNGTGTPALRCPVAGVKRSPNAAGCGSNGSPGSCPPWKPGLSFCARSGQGAVPGHLNEKTHFRAIRLAMHGRGSLRRFAGAHSNASCTIAPPPAGRLKADNQNGAAGTRRTPPGGSFDSGASARIAAQHRSAIGLAGRLS